MTRRTCGPLKTVPLIPTAYLSEQEEGGPKGRAAEPGSSRKKAVNRK